MAATRKQAPRARAAVIAFPGGGGIGVRALGRLAPSPRSILVGLALVAAAAAAYAAARETSMFAVTEIRVVGAPPAVAADVREALRPVEGRSLVAVSAATLDRRIAPLPDVVAARYDRAYPHTLVVHVTPERPLIVLRRGAESWLVSERGRVLRSLPRGARSALPRVWVPRRSEVALGAMLVDTRVRRALQALAPLADEPLELRPRTVRTNGELTLALRGGLEVRLGDTARLPLKLEIARRIVPLARGSRYVDISVPERPVVAANPQVDG